MKEICKRHVFEGRSRWLSKTSKIENTIWRTVDTKSFKPNSILPVALQYNNEYQKMTYKWRKLLFFWEVHVIARRNVFWAHTHPKNLLINKHNTSDLRIEYTDNKSSNEFRELGNVDENVLIQKSADGAARAVVSEEVQFENNSSGSEYLEENTQESAGIKYKWMFKRHRYRLKRQQSRQAQNWFICSYCLSTCSKESFHMNKCVPSLTVVQVSVKKQKQMDWKNISGKTNILRRIRVLETRPDSLVSAFPSLASLGQVSKPDKQKAVVRVLHRNSVLYYFNRWEDGRVSWGYHCITEVF